tara:strand:+ start:1484 stop:2566 length:1083 start_codon:yes stop_codon:yes gene_type:complete
MEKLNIAIAGTGFGASVHLPALKNSADLIPNCFFHHNKNKQKEIEIKYGLKCYSDWEELISNKNIDGIIIATPPEVRFDLARDALKNKKHLLLEKPVAITSEEIKELQKIALQENLSVCVDFEYRAVPLFLQAKEIIDEKTLGKIYLIKLDWLMSSRSDPNREWNWYSLSEKGGGVIGALGTHAFDILHWFFGDLKKVSAHTATSITKRPYSDVLFDVTSEDLCLANLEIDNNIAESLSCQISLSSVSKNGRGFSLEIYGSEGSLFLKSENQKDYVHGFKLMCTDKNNNMQIINPKDKFLFKETWEDGRIAPVKSIQSLWAESIIKGTPVIPGLSEGLISQKVAEAVKQSALTGLTTEII